MLKMAVFLSGSGRTLDNFHDRIAKGTLAGQIQVVVSNVKDVLGLTKAEKYGYPCLLLRMTTPESTRFSQTMKSISFVSPVI